MTPAGAELPDGTLASRAAELLAMQQAEEAEQVCRVGLSQTPNDRYLRYLMSQALLIQGHYLDGFREHECRVHRMECVARQTGYPEWDGPIAGRSILVWGEQGMGDEIMMARFIPTLRRLGATHITLTCWPQSVRALQQTEADLVLGRFGQVRFPKADCWVSALSIPHRLGLRLDEISGAPYLRAEPRGAGGIGLVSNGNAKNPRDIFRSIPADLLQAAVPQGRLLEPEGDVYDSMCRLAALDLLITVDTSWVHMAGALGVPCWVLLPYRGLDWRWLRERSDTPWYDSLRLFRQTTPGDWKPVLQAVATELNRNGVPGRERPQHRTADSLPAAGEDWPPGISPRSLRV